MPHQCLKCGHVFEEGSSQLLKGCPQCGGNRFFFTKAPLSEEERSVISDEVGQDLSERLMEVIEKKGGPELDPESGRWVTVKPSDIRKIFSSEVADAAGVDGSAFSEPRVEPIDDEFREMRLREIRLKLDSDESPETIEIDSPGEYAIDVRGLLEKEPIIIERDGSYSIHLPSVFKMINKDFEE